MNNATVIKASAATLLAIIGASAAVAAPASITGNWVTPERDAVIRIAPCGTSMCGTIAKYLKTPPDGVNQRDRYNPNKKLRSRKVLGIRVLLNFKPDGKKWRGKIYDARNGRSYRSVVYRGKSGRLIVKGCVGPICRTQKWSAR